MLPDLFFCVHKRVYFYFVKDYFMACDVERVLPAGREGAVV